MGWFSEQIELRKKSDDDAFNDALESIAEAVTGDKTEASFDKEKYEQTAINEILRYYHLRPLAGPLPGSVTTFDAELYYRLRPHGVISRHVTLTKGWYRDAIGPMILTYKSDGTRVALIPGLLSGYSFADRASGKKVKIRPGNENAFAEDALCFYKPLPQKPLTMKDLVQYTVSQLSMSDIILFVVLSLIATGLGMVMPIVNRLLFGDIMANGSVRVLFGLFGFMISYIICRSLFGVFNSLVTSRMFSKQNLFVEAAVMNRILSLPPTFFREYSSGELTKRAGYVRSLCSLLTNSVGTVGFASLFSLIYFGQVLAYAPSLVIPSLAITLAQTVLTLLMTKVQADVSERSMALSSKTSGMTYAIITGIQKIKLAGAEKRFFSRWAKAYREEASIEYNPPFLIKMGSTLSLAISSLGTMILYYEAVIHHVSVSDYYAFNSAYGMIAGAFSALTGVAMIISEIRPTLNMARPILEASPEVAVGKEIVTELKGAISVQNVSFRYSDDGPYIFDNLSLQINQGEYIAIVGKTGCGKSTLLRILLGFEVPEKGSVYYDRKNIRNLDLKSLRRKIGVVMQDGKLMMADIFTNIAISAPDITLDEAWEAAEAAQIAEDIRKMPMGMNTMISEGQGGISGGQKQRLMIARAVASKPSVLFFDEATSALDNVTQKKVSEAIDAMKCTRIAIAHRLSTIRHCTRIIVLDGGKIVENGTYEELIQANGLFAELVKRQRLDIEEEIG